MTFDLAKEVWYIVVFNFYFVIGIIAEILMLCKYGPQILVISEENLIENQKKIWGWPIYVPYLIYKKISTKFKKPEKDGN